MSLVSRKKFAKKQTQSEGSLVNYSTQEDQRPQSYVFRAQFWFLGQRGIYCQQIEGVVYPPRSGGQVAFASSFYSIDHPRELSLAIPRWVSTRNTCDSCAVESIDARNTSLWNSLLDYLCDPAVGRDTFRQHVKTFMFALY